MKPRGILLSLFSFVFTASALERPEVKTLWAVPPVKKSQAGHFQSSIAITMLRVPGKDYYLGQTEVTQGQWQQLMGYNPSRHKAHLLPVVRISWHEAMAFCRKLTLHDLEAGILPAGYVYSLPSESEWEHACRAGNRGDYAGALDDLAWFGEARGGPRPVATKKPNTWGFHDMHGNVWEWCRDRFGKSRPLRGGSWRSEAEHCRSHHRHTLSATSANNYLGFRPAAVPAVRIASIR